MIVQTINDTGIKMIGAPNEKLREIRVYVENTQVQFWVETKDGVEVMQYMSASEAMALSKALDRLAIESLRASANEGNG